MCYIMGGFPFLKPRKGLANACIHYRWDRIAWCVGVIFQHEGITRELTEICITSRVQKVWVVEFVNGPTEIPQWPFLSVPVRAFERGVCPKLHPKTV